MSEAEVRERLLVNWAPGTVDAMMLFPDDRDTGRRLETVGVEYRDGHYYDLRRSPQGGRKEQDNG